MSKNYMTVVFEYEDSAELPKKITEAFCTDSRKFQGVTISAVSLEDEISRAEKFEQHQTTFNHEN